MFTGIILSRQPIKKITERGNARVLSLDFSCRDAKSCVSTEGLEKGASVSVAGACLTVADIDGSAVSFDVIPETLARTTLGRAGEGEEVNIERAVKLGDEIGGHLIAGHVMGTARIRQIRRLSSRGGSAMGGEDYEIEFDVPKEWIKYIFSKGFIALDGCSLTVVDVDADAGTFTVSFIAETVARTTFGVKNVGDRVNVELDAQTVAIVDTVERMMKSK